MSFQLPPSLVQYGADLEAAIQREQRAGWPGRLRSWRTRPVRPAAALMTSAATAAVLVLSVDSGGGVTPAYAAFDGAASAPFVSKARCISHCVPTTITTATSFSWTDRQLTMTVHWTKHQGHLTTMQDRVWHARHISVLKATDITVTDPGGRAHQMDYFAFETIHGKRWSVDGGTTKEQNGTTMTVRLVSPIDGTFRFIQIDASGRTLTFKITSSTGWRTIAGR